MDTVTAKKDSQQDKKNIPDGYVSILPENAFNPGVVRIDGVFYKLNPLTGQYEKIEEKDALKTGVIRDGDNYFIKSGSKVLDERKTIAEKISLPDDKTIEKFGKGILSNIFDKNKEALKRKHKINVFQDSMDIKVIGLLFQNIINFNLIFFNVFK